jgi:hypothetical protein
MIFQPRIDANRRQYKPRTSSFGRASSYAKASKDRLRIDRIDIPIRVHSRLEILFASIRGFVLVSIRGLFWEDDSLFDDDAAVSA